MKNEPNSLKLGKTSLIVGDFFIFANHNKILSPVADHEFQGLACEKVSKLVNIEKSTL